MRSRQVSHPGAPPRMQRHVRLPAPRDARADHAEKAVLPGCGGAGVAAAAAMPDADEKEDYDDSVGDGLRDVAVDDIDANDDDDKECRSS